MSELRPVSTYFAILFDLRWVLGRIGNDPCDQWDIEEVMGLPDGLFYREGRVSFECRVCGTMAEWCGTVEEFEPDHYANVCGGSPRCCP